MALLGLSELQLSLLAGAFLCRVDFAGSKWLLVAFHSWSSRGDFQNLPNTQVLSQGEGLTGEGMSISVWGCFTTVLRKGTSTFFFFFFSFSQKCSSSKVF